MEPGGPIPHSQGRSNKIPIVSRINPIQRIDTDFFKIQTTKFLIVEPSSHPILVPLGFKYSPQDPVIQ